MLIFICAAHSKSIGTIDTKPLHIILHSNVRKPVDDLSENTSTSSPDYGALVQSECGLMGILIKTDVDAIKADDFEGMGLEYFRKKYGGIETVYFFMPPLLRTSQEIAIAEGLIPDEMVCERCRDNLEAKVRSTEWIVKRDNEEEGRRNNDVY
jgi:hypothetical protein